MRGADILWPPSIDDGNMSGWDTSGGHIKADTETAVNIFNSLFKKIWEKERIPEDWKEGILIKLLMKENLRDYNNNLGIMLLSGPGKVLNKILLEIIYEAVDSQLQD